MRGGAAEGCREPLELGSPPPEEPPLKELPFDDEAADEDAVEERLPVGALGQPNTVARVLGHRCPGAPDLGVDCRAPLLVRVPRAEVSWPDRRARSA